jgi:hypothetical protein
MLELNLRMNDITSVGVRALVDDTVEVDLLKSSDPRRFSATRYLSRAGQGSDRQTYFYVLRNKPKLSAGARNDEQRVVQQ